MVSSWIAHRSGLRTARTDQKVTIHKRILILGGGFSGLYSALHFDKTIAADPSIEVTLVSRENFALFTPMLTRLRPATWICPISCVLCAKC